MTLDNTPVGLPWGTARILARLSDMGTLVTQGKAILYALVLVKEL
jgi:hypothetical protein